jgi:hypothetical protein
MDAGIADTLNRRTVRLIVRRLDLVDTFALTDHAPKSEWYWRAMADTMLGDNDSTDSDRAWLVGALASRTPGVDFDEIVDRLDNLPADCDWENLFSCFRAEILARRDPQTHPACAAETPVRDGVGSR